MKATLGIIGGMGPLASHAFYGHLIAETPARRDQDHMHVIIDSDPSIPDRTPFLLGDGPDPRPAIVAAGQRLIGAGADLLVMPCNTANAFVADIRPLLSVPVFDWIGAAVAAVLETGAGKVGILATDGTLKTGLYQSALRAAGIQSVVPPAHQQAAVMRVIYEGVKAGRTLPTHEQELIQAALGLEAHGADALLLGCTELPLAVCATDERWPIPAVDPSLASARRIVAQLLSED